MSKPLFTNVPDLDYEKWNAALDLISDSCGGARFVVDCVNVNSGECPCYEQAKSLFGECPPPPAPDFRIDRSDGGHLRVSCLAGDRVHLTGSGVLDREFRSADAIELGEALIAAGRYLEAHR